MHSQQSTFAVIVSAETFELLNSRGEVVADLAVPPPSAPVADAGLAMRHLDPDSTDSALAWTTVPDTAPGSPLLELVGPTSSADALAAGPRIRFTYNANFSGENQVTIGTGRPDSTVFENGAQVQLTGNPGAANPTAIIQTSTPAGAASLDLTGNTAVLSATGAGSGVLLSSNGNSGMYGDTSAIIRRGVLGPFVQAVNDDVYLGPQNAGRVYLNNRPTWQMLGQQQLALPGNISVGYRSFLMNTINTVSGVPGDIYTITATCRVLCAVAAGAFIFEYQGFGGGAGVSAQRGVATQWAAGHDATLTAVWSFTQTIAGIISWAIVGGQTGGSWILVAPDSWFTVTHYGIR